jgi:hypothetical protein
MHVHCTYLTKKNSEHPRKYERQGTEDKRRRNRGREAEEQRTGTEKGTLEQFIGIRGWRKEDGTQGKDHVREGTEEGGKVQRREKGTEDERQGTETKDKGRRTGDGGTEGSKQRNKGQEQKRGHWNSL